MWLKKNKEAKMRQQNELKKKVAQAAIDYVPSSCILGVGTGSTVEYFIDALSDIKGKVEGAVASSAATEAMLRHYQIPVIELNHVKEIDLYIDGADEFNSFLSLIKGGGGALTREKIVAAASKQFICIVDQSKQVKSLGQFPLPIEVIPMARGYVARQLVMLGGSPEYREGFVTDNGNIILDVYGLNLSEPIAMERQLNNIVGVVTNGLFAERGADLVLMATDSGVETISQR